MLSGRICEKQKQKADEALQHAGHTDWMNIEVCVCHKQDRAGSPGWPTVDQTHDKTLHTCYSRACADGEGKGFRGVWLRARQVLPCRLGHTGVSLSAVKKPTVVHVAKTHHHTTASTCSAWC